MTNDTTHNGRNGRFWGEGFQSVDPLIDEFPNIDVETIRAKIEVSLKDLKSKGYTGVQEKLEFDEHGLLVGKYHQNSFISDVQLRAQVDLMNFFKKLAEGRDFDAHFSYDQKTRVGTISFMLKRHTDASKIFTVDSRLREE